MNIKLEFKLQDLWIGGYYQYVNEDTHLYICLVPCLPIHFTWKSKRAEIYTARKFLLQLLKIHSTRIKGIEESPFFTLEILHSMLKPSLERRANNLLTQISDDEYLALQIASGQATGWWFYTNKWVFVKWCNLARFRDRYSLN